MFNKEKIKKLNASINNYLQNGGLWNPELMEHDKVRHLLLDIREQFVNIINDDKEGGKPADIEEAIDFVVKYNKMYGALYIRTRDVGLYLMERYYPTNEVEWSAIYQIKNEKEVNMLKNKGVKVW